MTIEGQRYASVFHSITAFRDLVVTVQWAGHDVALTGCTAAPNLDPIRAGNDLAAVAGGITFEYKIWHDENRFEYEVVKMAAKGRLEAERFDSCKRHLTDGRKRDVLTSLTTSPA
jgi:hypothetical protein